MSRYYKIQLQLMWKLLTYTVWSNVVTPQPKQYMTIHHKTANWLKSASKHCAGWRWRRHGSLKHKYPTTWPHIVTTQKTTTESSSPWKLQIP